MPKPICVGCQRFYYPKRNGFAFIEGMPVPSDARPGKAEPEKWKPYKLWRGDLWECEGCLAQIVVGCGSSPMRVQHEDDFAEIARRYNATFQVNDC